MDNFVVPNDVGKIPRKIVSSFDGFTLMNIKIGYYFLCIQWME